MKVFRRTYNRDILYSDIPDHQREIDSRYKWRKEPPKEDDVIFRKSDEMARVLYFNDHGMSAYLHGETIREDLTDKEVIFYAFKVFGKYKKVYHIRRWPKVIKHFLKHQSSLSEPETWQMRRGFFRLAIQTRILFTLRVLSSDPGWLYYLKLWIKWFKFTYKIRFGWIIQILLMGIFYNLDGKFAYEWINNVFYTLYILWWVDLIWRICNMPLIMLMIKARERINKDKASK